jgi:hypothetical protein
MMRPAWIVAAFLSVGLVQTGEVGAQESLGRFPSELNWKALPDGRKMQLTHPFSYIDATGKLWAVPTGVAVDGASIPSAFWSIIGAPFEDKYREASVIHDYYCDQKTETWEDTHLVFYNAMLAREVSATKAKLMYAAVYGFGPRWIKVGSTPEGATLISGQTILANQAKEAIIKFVTENDPAPDAIKKVIDQLVRVENIEQLERILYENVGCTPILADTASPSDVTKTIVLCGLSKPSKKQAAISNLRTLNTQLRNVLIANHWGLTVVQQYIKSPTLDNWNALAEWSRNTYGLIKIAMRSALDLQDGQLQSIVPTTDELFGNLSSRAAMLSPILPNSPKSVQEMDRWERDYRRLVEDLRGKLDRIQDYLKTIPG